MQFKIRKLGVQEEIPYDLLLLADENMDAINKYIHQSEIFVLVAKGELIAVYVLLRLNKGMIEIKNIAVSENFQGQGVGTFLLEDATNRAIEKGYSTLIIGTGDGSIKQLYLYQKVGFEIYDIKKRFFLDNYPKPIFENGLQLRHMIMLKKDL